MKMYKKIVFLILCFAAFNASAQDYERIDATILLYPETFDSPEALSKFITRDFATDEEKVRAMYSWIIQNIKYDPNEYKQFNFNFKNYRERNEKEEKTREKIIKHTLQKGVAVCEGYAMLLEKLCELQGIPNYLVRGDIKSNFDDIGRPFKKSHMWNVISIEGKNYLYDATWGAGKYNRKFIKEPSYFYYKTPPQSLIKTHYPDMFEDAFISENITRQQFSDLPLIIDKSLKIEHIIKPISGIILAEEYFDSVLFSIKNSNPIEVSYSYGNEITPVKDFEKSENSISFSVPLEIGGTNLLIFFDGKPALGYKIK
jgi:hypothetical protein